MQPHRGKMNPLSRLLLIIAAAFVALTFGANTINAQDRDPKCPDLDPVCVAPDHYKVVYEDDDVRVLHFKDKQGDAIPLHKHAHPYQVYSITASQRQFFMPDCNKKDGSVKQLAANHLLPLSMPVMHCETNVGSTDAFLVVVEYKKDPSTPQPPTAPTQVRRPVKSSRPTRR